MSNRKIPSMDARKMRRALMNLGFERVGDRGDHQIMERNGRQVDVAWHSNVPPGTVIKMLRRGGITREEFLGAIK